MYINVENLSSTITEEDLLNLFEKFGTVDSVIIGEHGRSNNLKRFAVIEMNQRQQGISAIHALNGMVLNELPLSINELKGIGYGLFDFVPVQSIFKHLRQRIYYWIH